MDQFATGNTSFDRFIGTIKESSDPLLPSLQQPKAFFTSEAYLRQGHRADWQHVDSRLAVFAAAFVLLARKRGVPLFVHSAFRTKAEQERVYRGGYSGRVWPVAAHCQGAAVDIVHSVHAWGLSKAEWAVLGKLGKDLNTRMNMQVPAGKRLILKWGGDWRTKRFPDGDPAHWEIEHWDKTIKYYEAGEPVRMTPSAIIAANRLF